MHILCKPLYQIVKLYDIFILYSIYRYTQYILIYANNTDTIYYYSTTALSMYTYAYKLACVCVHHRNKNDDDYGRRLFIALQQYYMYILCMYIHWTDAAAAAARIYYLYIYISFLEAATRFIRAIKKEIWPTAGEPSGRRLPISTSSYTSTLPLAHTHHHTTSATG